jgi:hypothetical protein
MTRHKTSFAKMGIRAAILAAFFFLLFILTVSALGAPLWKLRESGLAVGTLQLTRWLVLFLADTGTKLLSPGGLLGTCIGFYLGYRSANLWPRNT